MKRFKSMLCASLVTFAISSTAAAGNISVGVASTGNISVGAASAGNISIGAASQGNISVGKADYTVLSNDFDSSGYLLLLISMLGL